ncbi:hypothetical protein TNCV_4270331 [Trichonephila clavipes]|nr:hypothetical protein TNCV_4270331 [Trichonephila clavipes]
MGGRLSSGQTERASLPYTGRLEAWTNWTRSEGLDHNGGLVSFSTQLDSNNFNGQMLLPVVFYEKLGISEDMSTDFM